MDFVIHPTSYAFFPALSDRISDLVKEIEEARPGALSYRGMDFSHAFELWLYVNLANEDALHKLYETQGEAAEIRQFSSELAYMLARSWFGEAVAHRGRSSIKRWASLLRPLRPFLGRGGISFARSRVDGDYELLFFATSLRFARYMMPVATAWKGRCAFLVSRADAQLQEVLRAEGYAVVTYGSAGPGWRRLGLCLARYAPGLALLADEMEAAIRSVGARLILLPEGNAPEDEVVNRVGHRIGVKVACLQQGWSPLVHTGFRNMTYDSMLVWGQGFAELLRPYNPGQHFAAVGSHVLFENFEIPAWQRNGAVIFSMGMGLWLKPEEELLLIGLAPHIARRLPDHVIYVRPHPRHPFDDETLRDWAKHPNIQVAAWPAVSLADVLSRSRVAVSVYSSTILESIASGTVPVIFNMTTMPRFLPDVDRAGAGIEVRTFEQAADVLVRLMSDPEAAQAYEPSMSAFREKYFAARGEAALARIVGELEQLVTD